MDHSKDPPSAFSMILLPPLRNFRNYPKEPESVAARYWPSTLPQERMLRRQ